MTDNALANATATHNANIAANTAAAMDAATGAATDTATADTVATDIAAVTATANPPMPNTAMGTATGGSAGAGADAFQPFFAALRARFAAARPPPEIGPTSERPLAVRVDGLCWGVVGDAEPRVLRVLRRDLAARFGGPDGLERRYAGGERVGYLTHVRHRRDADWLRLRVALLAERAGLALGVLRVVVGGV